MFRWKKKFCPTTSNVKRICPRERFERHKFFNENEMNRLEFNPRLAEAKGIDTLPKIVNIQYE
jgi:hypothetical protein